jgi:drug/metabolite transporter (DMT)-like permease
LLFAGAQQRTGRIVPAVMLGLVAGVIGAVFILGPRMDLVPDEIERMAGAVLVMLGSLGLVVAILVRSTRR